MTTEVGMLCSIDSDTFFHFIKNTLIGDSGASCHRTNDGTISFTMTDNDKLIREAPAKCQQRKESFVSISTKLMVLNRSTLYGS